MRISDWSSDVCSSDLSGRYDAYVALGVVIRGETYHFEVVSNESARGIMALTLDGLAIGNGILTVEDEDQAPARADRTRGDTRGGDATAAPGPRARPGTLVLAGPPALQPVPRV